MEQFEGLGECPQLADMSDETVKVAAYLYNLLVMSVKNKARKIGRSEGRVETNNGFVFYYRLLEECEPRTQGRHQNMLIELLARPD